MCDDLELTILVLSFSTMISMNFGESYCDVMVKLQDISFKESEFELKSRYNFHFRTNTLEKSMNPNIPTVCVK